MKNKISSLMFSSIIVNLCSSIFFGILSSFMFSTSKNSTIYSMIIGFIISLILDTFILRFFNKKEGLFITDKFKYIYKKFSIVINIMFIILSMLCYIFISYRLTSFISSQYLTNTNKILIHLLIVLTSLYISSKGFETISRVSFISVIISLAIFLFNFTSLIPYVKLTNLLPIYIVNTSEMIKSSIYFSIAFTVPTIYINYISKDNIKDKNNFNKCFYLSIAFTFILLLSIVFVCLGVYGYNLVNLFDYPLYTALERISLSTFIDSVENISVMLWLLFILNASSVIGYTTIKSIKKVFNIKNYNIINIAFGFITTLIPYIFFINNSYVETYSYLKTPMIIFSILYILIFISNLLIKKER